MRIVWQTVRRITDEILGVKGLNNTVKAKDEAVLGNTSQNNWLYPHHKLYQHDNKATQNSLGLTFNKSLKKKKQQQQQRQRQNINKQN